MKLHLNKVLRAALMAAVAFASAQFSAYADSATWTPDTVITEALTGGGTITLDGAVDPGDITFNGADNWNIVGSSLEGDGNITKNGSSTLTIKASTDLNTTGYLTINEGTVQFGENTTNGQEATMNFSHIVVNAGATFTYSSRAKDADDSWGAAGDHSNTNVILNGGTWDNFGMGPNTWAYFNTLELQANSNFTTTWGGFYDFAKLAGVGDLAIGTGSETRRFDFAQIHNYNGVISGAGGIDSFVISSVNQSASFGATINGINVTGNNFVLEGGGSLTIGQNLHLTGATAQLNSSTLTLQGQLTGTTALHVSGILSMTGTSLNAFEGDLVLDDGTLELSSTAAITKTIQVGVWGGYIQSADGGTLVFNNTFTYAEGDVLADSYAIRFESSADLSGATIDVTGLASGSYYLFYGYNSLVTEGISVIGVSGRGGYSLSVRERVVSITLDTAAAAAMLDWGVGAGIWKSSLTRRVWQGSVRDARFYEGDHVTFSDDAGAMITVEGTVNPGSISIEGAGDWHFASGIIGGRGSLVMDGSGTLTLSASNSYTGGTEVNSGRLMLGTVGATGTGDVNVASSATLALGYNADLSTLDYINFSSGSTLELAVSNGTYTGGLKDTLASGMVLRVGDDMGTITITEDGVVGSDGAGTTLPSDYYRTTEGYTVSVGEGSILDDKVRLALSGETTTVTGKGTYQVDSIVMTGATAVTSLQIDEGATLKVTGERLSAEGGDGVDGNSGALYGDRPQGSFQVSEWNKRNSVNIYGTLDLNSGISSRDGSALITVGMEDGTAASALILRKGLSATGYASPQSDIVVNKGATLELYNQSTTTDHSGVLRVTLNEGATIAYGREATGEVNVYTALSFADGANVNFVAGAQGETLAIKQNVTLAKATLTGANGGTISFDGASSNIGTIAGDGSTVVATRGALTLGSATDMATLALNSADASVAISGSLQMDSGVTIATKPTRAAGEASITVKSGSALSYIANDQVVGVVIDGAAISSSNLINLSNSTIQNASISGTEIVGYQDSSSILNSTLTSVTLKTGGGQLTLGAGSVVMNSSIEAGVLVEAGVKFNATGSSITGASVNQTTYASFETSEGGTLTDPLVYQLSNLNTLLQSATGQYTLDVVLTMDQMIDFKAAYDTEDGMVLFELTGVADLATWYGNITLAITDGTDTYNIKALGMVDTGSNIVLYIPEPSSATLSLLALAGLLARRRRKVA